MHDTVHVAAAAIVNADNEVLISKRAEHTHQGGLWEFPGGKLDSGESVEQGLHRELAEELGISASAYRPLIKVLHQYSDKTVLLDVWKVTAWNGEPFGREGQPLAWHAVDSLHTVAMPAADVPVVNALKLPAHYMITGHFTDAAEFETRFTAALDRGIRLAQLRLTSDWLQPGRMALARKVVAIAQRLCEHYAATLLYNLPDALSEELRPAHLHLNSRKLNSLARRPDCELLSASCHTMEELHKAQQLDADFLVLSPVQPTASHPDAEPLGWPAFADMVSQVNIPVYALGGVGENDCETAWRCGAQGVAGIGAFWN